MKGYMDIPLNARITFARSFGAGADPLVQPRIEIEDATSGTTILRMNLEAADLAEMMAGGQVRRMADVTAPHVFERQVGKNMEILVVPVEDWPSGWTRLKPGPWHTGYSSDQVTDEMADFAERLASEREYETWDWHRSRDGWALALRRWVDVDEEHLAKVLSGELR